MSKEFENVVLDFISFAKGKFSDIDSRLDGIDSRLDGIDLRLNKIDAILIQHGEQLNSLHESVAIIEQKVQSDFPALFEAFEMHQQLHKEYDEKLSYLSIKTEENSMKISVLEDQMKFIKTN